MSSQNSDLLGVVLLTRHGDRRGFYQSESSYTASETKITPLGNQQMFSLGSLLRERYLNRNSSNAIPGISADLANQTQVQVRADAGGEGGVIWDSVLSLLQGLYPANTAYNETLANGTRVTGPLNGYQYLPVESVEPSNDVSLEGWTSCGAFDNSTKALYASDIFKQQQTKNQDFLNDLPQYLDGRNVSFQNMWNIYDFMNVRSIHDSTFAQRLPSGYLAKARDLANWHEYHVFSSSNKDGISNIAGRAIIPSILSSISQIANTSQSGMKFAYTGISYKPFISLFNMTGAAEQNSQLAGIVNYAAAVVLEVRSSDKEGGAVVQLKFKNGTDDSDFHSYGFLGGDEDGVSVEQFRQALTPYAINNTENWCTACGNTQDRGCAGLTTAFSQGQQSAASSHHGSGWGGPISPVGAGFLGAGLTIAVFLAMLGVLAFMGLLTFGKGKRGRKVKGVDEEK